MHLRRGWLVAVALGLLLGGCVGAPLDGEKSSPEPSAAGTIAPQPRPGQTAHVHDYWGGETELVLYEGSVPVTVAHNHAFDEPPRPQHTHSCDESLDSTSQGGSVKFALPPGDIVLPGTQRLEVSASWTAPTITGLRLLYRAPAHGAEHHDGHGGHGGHGQHGDFRDAGALGNGASVSIALTPEMADLGHETRSRWAFFLCADTDDINLAEGNVDLAIRAHRAEQLPLDPPHPDHWAGNATLLLARVDWSGSGWAIGNQADGAWHQVRLAHQQIVPAEADHLIVTVWFNATGPSSALPGAVNLYYKDSTVPDWIYQRMPASLDKGVARFSIPLNEPGMTDSPYASRSNWDFWVRLSSPTDASMPAGLGTWTAPHAFEGTLAAQVVVFRR